MFFKPLIVAALPLFLAGHPDVTSTVQNVPTLVSGVKCATPAAAAANAAALRDMINAARAKAGIAPVALSPRATKAAQAFACEISARRNIDHIGNDGSNVADRLARVGVRVSVVAENTADRFTTPAKAMAAWMASTGHRNNILTPEATQMGIGQAEGDYPTWVLVLYAPL